MGQAQNKKYKVIQLTLTHPDMPNPTLITSEEETLIQSKYQLDKKTFDKWVEGYRKVEQLNNEFILQARKLKYEEEGMCSGSGTGQILYEYYPMILSEELDEREAFRRRFEESEIWYLIFTLASVKNSISCFSSKIGDVRPENIFINRAGAIKISTLHTFPTSSSNYTKTLEEKLQTYLSPEQLQSLRKGELEPEENTQAEIFSIGLTVLSAAILQNLQPLYDIKEHTLDEEELEYRLSEMKTLEYSQILKSTISNMCKLSPSARMTLDELWKLVGPHEEQIKKKENFVVYNAPQKLHLEVESLRKTMPLLRKTLSMKKKNKSMKSP